MFEARDRQQQVGAAHKPAECVGRQRSGALVTGELAASGGYRSLGEPASGNSLETDEFLTLELALLSAKGL